MFRESDGKSARLVKYLSPIGAWALAFGCSVGWGSFVMPGTTFLPLAGPMGTAIGMLIGGLVMLVIGINYHYMMNHYPGSGGVFSYCKHEFGYDQGFLSAWALLLVYMAIVWANATAIPLICRNLFPGVFNVGPYYTVAGFTVYLYEACFAAAMIILAGVICLLGGKVSSPIQTFFAVALIGGILLCAGYIAFNKGVNFTAITPRFCKRKIQRRTDILHSCPCALGLRWL